MDQIPCGDISVSLLELTDRESSSARHPTVAPSRRCLNWTRHRDEEGTTVVVQHETRPGLADSTVDSSLSSKTGVDGPVVPASKAGDGLTGQHQSLRQIAQAGRSE